MSPEQVESIADELGHPPYDPHGDPIPTRQGSLPPRRGQPLAARPAGWAGRVVHVEDEPPEMYRRLAKDGFAPDVRLRVEESGAAGLRVLVDGRHASPSRATPPGRSPPTNCLRASASTTR